MLQTNNFNLHNALCKIKFLYFEVHQFHKQDDSYRLYAGNKRNGVLAFRVSRFLLKHHFFLYHQRRELIFFNVFLS